MSHTNGKPKVYSYLRFSTPEQSLGDSERRQLDAAKAWAKRHDLELDESLTPDRGLSGYHGHHRTKGNLGKFLALVEAGSIPSGSILLVEAVDRLSREGLAKTLREIIFKLWDHGIVLQTLSPEGTYKPGCDGDPNFIALFIYMQLAQRESQQKSERVGAARDRERRQAREDGRYITGLVPAWLKVHYKALDAKRKMIERVTPIPEAVDTINRIFEMKLSGMGTNTIVRTLNATAAWTPQWRNTKAKGWNRHYVRSLLRGRAVVGEYQPHLKRGGRRRPIGPPIPNYYPAIVKPEIFEAVQPMLSANWCKGGRVGKALHLLRHVAKCGYCGGPMAFVGNGRYYFLVCNNARRCVRDGGRLVCERHSIRYDEVESLVLEHLPCLKLEQVLPDPTEQTKRCRSLRLRIEGKTAELTKIEKQIRNLVDQVSDADDKSLRSRYEDRIKELSERKATLEADKKADETELEKAEQNRESFTAWQRNLRTLKQELAKGDLELRERLQSHLRQQIERIEVYPSGLPKAPKPNLKGVPEEFHAFLKHIAEQKATKAGRFLRIHFRFDSDYVAELNPLDSVAGDLALTPGFDGKWRFSNPKHAALYQEFRKTRENARTARR